MSNLLFTSSEWTVEGIHKSWEVIKEIAKRKYQLDFPEPQIEIVTARQMLHYSANHGLPVLYNHWSFGHRYAQENRHYVDGVGGLAYEMIINSNPAICYILDSNSSSLQALVIAHACIGHGSFFKMNSMFQTSTSPDTVLEYSRFAKKYIATCESKYGEAAVERVLDAAHALQWASVDRSERARLLKNAELEERIKANLLAEEQHHNPLWRVFKPLRKPPYSTDEAMLLDPFKQILPEENILYFLEKHSPVLDEWQREILRIVRYFAQYLYPQICTKTMNEGWASFWHYTLVNDLYDEGYLNEGQMLEILENHTAVVSKHMQPSSESGTFSHFNPYALGFRMFQKLRQACENPKPQDYEELPGIVNTNWVETFKDIAENYNDSSFFGQFLTSEIMEEFKMVSFELGNNQYDEEAGAYPMTILHNQDRKRLSHMRKELSESKSYAQYFPLLEVTDYDHKNTRSITITHTPVRGQLLEEKTLLECMKHIKRLWGNYSVHIQTIDSEGNRILRGRKY